MVIRGFLVEADTRSVSSRKGCVSVTGYLEHKAKYGEEGTGKEGIKIELFPAKMRAQQKRNPRQQSRTRDRGWQGGRKAFEAEK